MSTVYNALRSASLLLYFNVYKSMADKRQKRRLYFLCYCCFYTQYGNEKGKVNTIISSNTGTDRAPFLRLCEAVHTY